MSKLETLIQQLCPDGVEYKKLNEVVEIKRGIRVVRSQLFPDGKYPVYQNSLTPLGYYEKSNVRANTTFIIAAGAAGEIGYSTVDFWAADDCFYFECGKIILNKYIYYLLLKNKYLLLSKVRKASIPRLSRVAIEQLLVPVPPLEIQREIVRILDNFTELTAELTARKKQYEYYRNRLLAFDVHEKETTNVVWKALGEVCELRAGKAISSNEISKERTPACSIPCYGGNGLRGYVRFANQKGEKSLIGRQGALCGNVCYAIGDYYATEHAVVVTDKGYFNSRFLYHLLVYANLNQYKTAGAQPGLSVSRLEKVMIAVPSMLVQNKIAHVLDNFEAICSDLNIGLPAEIEARQKQYEYYRDALLTYTATGATILTDRQTDRQTGHN